MEMNSNEMCCDSRGFTSSCLLRVIIKNKIKEVLFVRRQTVKLRCKLIST